MIGATLTLQFEYDAEVYVFAGTAPLRMLKDLHVGDYLRSPIRFVDRMSKDVLNLPAGTNWRFAELKIDPIANDERYRTITLVRVIS